MATGLKESRTRSGEALRSELCTASGSQAPRSWDEPALNRLLDLADAPKEARDPLAFKQALAALSPELGSLGLKARKEMMAALAAHATTARGYGHSGRFGVWPPEALAPPPPSRPRQPLERRADPMAGAADGYRWTQSESELSIAVAVPAGTSKTEVMLQMTPRHGPATVRLRPRRYHPSLRYHPLCLLTPLRRVVHVCPPRRYH